MKEKKILIIHLRRLGDMVQSLPAIKLLKETHPNSVITYLGIEEFSSILVNVPWIDNLVTLPWQEIRPIMGERNEVNIATLERSLEITPELKEEYNLLINMTHNWTSSYLCERTKSREKRGRVFSKDNEVSISGNWGNYLFAMARDQKSNLLNVVDIYMGLVGAKNRPTGQFLPTDPIVDQRCASLLSDLGLENGKLSIGLQIGASKLNKRWPLKSFVKLGELLFKRAVGQSINLVFEEIFDPEFTDFNFGFRRGKSQRQAIKYVQGTVLDGYEWCASIDLKSLFDEILHNLILNSSTER